MDMMSFLKCYYASSTVRNIILELKRENTVSNNLGLDMEWKLSVGLERNSLRTVENNPNVALLKN